MDDPALFAGTVRAGGKRQDMVVCLWHDIRVDYGIREAGVDVFLLFLVGSKICAVDVARRADLLRGEDLEHARQPVAREVNVWVRLRKRRVHVIDEAGKHRAVIHVVAIQDGIEIREIIVIFIVHEN